MSVQLNRIIIAGRLCRDPETKTLQNGTKLATFRLASGRKLKNSEEEEVCFVDVTSWNRTAEFVEKYLTKGTLILVEGSLKFEQWEKDGQKRSKHSINAQRLQFIGSKQQRVEGAQETHHAEKGALSRAIAEGAKEAPHDGEDSEMPF